eukprot:TRINITY_DN2811_c0_g1_i2.p1 TRINITY_DN2811_c0_g1~~TRINITY_DN2811_c0_g1_i2.p1  ORF type:complete len:148 (+),score=28.87 TRINITY_DN2811_c0_g1_i2:610-1053(+)
MERKPSPYGVILSRSSDSGSPTTSPESKRYVYSKTPGFIQGTSSLDGPTPYSKTPSQITSPYGKTPAMMNGLSSSAPDLRDLRKGSEDGSVPGFRSHENLGFRKNYSVPIPAPPDVTEVVPIAASTARNPYGQVIPVENVIIPPPSP